MTLNEYQKETGRTSRNLSVSDTIREGCYGMCGEAGECIDFLKKVEFQGHEFDEKALMKELGDVLFYVARTASGLGVTLNDVALMNIEKRKTRYPNGFDSGRSIHRPKYERGDINGQMD